MPRRPRRFYAFATTVYLAVVAVLVLLALFARGSTERLGEARVTVRYRAWPLFGSMAQRASISFRGLRLSFDRGHPLAIGGSESGLESVRAVSDGVDVRFEGGARLELRSSDEDYSLSLVAADQGEVAASLTIPFRIPAAEPASGDLPALGWSRGGASCYISLPPGSSIDPRAGRMEIAFAADDGQALRFGSSASARQVLAARWLSDQASMVDAETWERALAVFRDAAWRGWTRERVSGDGTMWRAADGTWSFADPVAPALLAEALARGTYVERRAAAIPAMGRQLDQASGTATLAASAYLGWLPLFADRMQSRESAGVARIKERVAAADSSVFATPSVVPYMLDHGVLADLQALMTFADSLVPADLDAAAALGALEAWLDYATWADDSGQSAPHARAIVEQRILPSIRKTGRGLYFTAAPDRVDTALSITCGQLLERAAPALGEDRLGAIGRTIVASAIELVHPDGFLPKSLRLSGDQLASQDGSLAPEAVYERVGGGRYLPREVPLYRSVGPGAWIWTAARVGPVEATASVVRISVTFPPGMPHYMLVAGLRPFKELRLHGSPWRGDPAFAQGSDGWSWDNGRELLSVKLTGKAETEQIVISY